MKLKIIIPLIIAIGIGYFFGQIIFNQYNKNITDVFNEGTKVYFLQQGVYTTPESMEKQTTKVKNYIYTKDKKYYRTYVAITKDSSNVNKLKDLFVKLGNDIYVKETTINNSDFISLLTQYDKLIQKTTDSNSIVDITKEVLIKYKELVADNGKNLN